MPDEVIKRVEQLGTKDNQPRLLNSTDNKGDVLIGNDEQEIEDDLSYDKMSYKSSYSLTIDEIQGVQYNPETVDRINNDNVEPFEDTMDDLSVATSESEENDLIRNIISNVSVPDTGRKGVMNVEGNPFNHIQPFGDVMKKPSEPIPTKAFRAYSYYQSRQTD